jgi:XRE family aerobic/anaerobic benzoate catabolism transcriptional regulator
MLHLVLDLGPLGASVRAARQGRAMTLRDLADRSGVSLRFLSDLEHGKGNISIAKLALIAEALEAPLSALVAPLDRRPSRTITLVGLRGAGKSTIGAKLAAALEVPFIELDVEIERAAGLSISQLFELYGEAYYRRLERETLERILAKPKRCVIATGGGIVSSPETWRLLRQRTQTVWLEASPEAHYERVRAQGDLRPMRNRPSAMAELRALLSARSPSYREAELTVDTEGLGVRRSVEAILAAA